MERKIISSIVGDNYNGIFVESEHYFSGLGEDVRPIDLLDEKKFKGKTYVICLSTCKWISRSISFCPQLKIHIIRTEGDFKIYGRRTFCDCSHCLLTNILDYRSVYKFSDIALRNYHAGFQYSVLTYLNPKYFNLSKPSSSEKLFHSIEQKVKPRPYDYYKLLGSPKYFSAPMVGASELAFRMLLREHGNVQVCYTPMMFSDLFLESREYRDELFSTCMADRPLVAQFSGNNPTVLLKAAERVQNDCSAIDINFGCPQPTGRRNHYGAWLMEDWDLIYSLIEVLHKQLSIPVWCKIRIFDNIEKTVQYAKMIEKAGCSLLTVHGRQRNSPMNKTPPDWKQIAAVKQALKIPVVFNGGVDSLETANHCLEITNCDAVMAASNILKNPLLFSSQSREPKELILLYLKYAARYKALLRYVKPHIIQIAGMSLNEEEKNNIKKCNSISDVSSFIQATRFRDLSKHHEDSMFHDLLEYS